MPEPQNADLIVLTSQIVSAHVGHNTVPVEQLPGLIRDVYAALGNANAPAPEPKEPAVPLKQSVRPDAITCLECGGQYKMLKRHLNTEHKMTPAQYRDKWKLPIGYPIVAPNYAKTRSSLAKKIGLGHSRKASATSISASRKKAGAKRKSA